MKKTLLIAGAMLITATAVQAQKATRTARAPKAYLRIGAGYGFTHAGDMQVPFGTVNSGPSSTSYSLKKASLGAGASVSLAGGYMISRHIGLELGVHAIVAPKKFKATYTESGVAGNSTVELTTYAKLPVYVVPAIVLTTGGSGMSVYSRFGLVLPVADKVILKIKNNDPMPLPATVAEGEIVTKNRFTIGFQGALGVSFPVGSSVGIFVEANGISRTAYTKSAEITAYTENGVDMLSTLTTNDKMTNYEFEYTDNSGQANPSEPRKSDVVGVPFSSVGLSVGVKFAF